MEAADLLLQLKQKIASPSVADVFKALYLDPLVLQALNDPDTMEKVSTQCGDDAVQWIPSRIGLAASGLDLDLDALLDSPLPPLSAELRQQMTSMYQRVLVKDYTITTLTEAVSVALAMRERRRLTNSWAGLSKEITRNFSTGSFNYFHWQTPFAILYGLIPDSEDLMQELTHLNGYLPSEEYSALILHVYLLNSRQDQDWMTRKAIDLINSLPVTDRAGSLDWLEQHGYEYLTEVVAQNLTNELYLGKELPVDASAFVVDPLEKQNIFEQLSSINKQIKIIDYQKNTPIKDALLQEEERLLHQAEAILLARKIADRPNEPQLNEWKKVASLVPDSDLARAHLAMAHIQARETGLAAQVQFTNTYHPLVLAVKAFLANKQSNLVEADLYLDHLTSALHSSTSLNRQTANQIVQLVADIDLPGKVEQVFKSLPYGMPAQDTVMRATAFQLYKAGKYPQARQYAEASLLLNDQDLDAKRLLAKSYEKEGDDRMALTIWDDLANNQADPASEDKRGFAASAIRCGEAERAIGICRSMIETNPIDGRAFVLLGDAYQQTSQYDMARDSYEKAVTIAPELEESWIKLVNYHLAHSEQERAIEILSTAIKAVPNSAGLHYQLGCLNTEADSTVDAIQQFQQAYNIDPKNLEYARALGKSLLRTGRLDDAEEVLSKAIKTFPFDQNLLRTYGQVLVGQNKKVEALVPYQALIDLHPMDADPYIEFSRLVVEDLTGGIGVTVSRDDPQYALVMYTRDSLETAVENCPSVRLLQLYLAEILAKLSDREDSRTMFAELSEYTFELPADLRWRVNYGLGMTSGEMGEYDVALAALQEAANQNPSHFKIHQQLAEAYLRANLGQSAMQAAQQALSIDPKDPDNLVWYAEFCTRSNELPEALSTLDAILKIQPENIELRIKLGSLQLRTNMNDDAKNTFRKLLSDSKLKTAHYQQIAQLLANAEEYGEAIGFLKLGIQAEPQTSLPLLLDLVQYEQKSGDISSALQTIEQAIGLDPLNIRLQIVKADMLAYAGDFDGGIQTLEQAYPMAGAVGEDGSCDPSTGKMLYEIYLRLGYLYRRSGAIIQSRSYAQKCLALQENELEASYLLADLSFNQLQYAEAIETLTQASSDKGEYNKFSELAGILLPMVYAENNQFADARREVESLILGSRWTLWKSALDILTRDDGQLDLKVCDAIKQDLEGLALADIQQLIPGQEKKFHTLPDLPVYNAFTFSPTLYLVIALAAARAGAFETAQNILDGLRDQYPYEVSPVFAIARVYTLQAEQHRLLEKSKVCKHLPASDSLSLGAFETFEEMILATERISSADVVEDWHKRGTAAFYPTIDNFNAMLERPAFSQNPTATIWKLSLENKIGDLAEFLDKVQADVDARCLASILTTEKAPAEAMEMIQPVVDFLAVHPRCLAVFAIVASNAGALEPALDTIENALSIWDNEPEWHILAAKISIILNHADGALFHLKIAAEIEPEEFSYAMEMGNAAAKFGDPVQAIQYFRKAAHIDPVNATPWYAIAKAYQTSGDLNQAVASIERSVTLAPDNPEPQILSAEFSLQAGKINEALKKIDAALRIDSKNVDALNVKTRALHAGGHSDEALEVIENALKKVSNPLPLLLTRADIIRSQEGPKAYLKSLHEVAQDYPKDTQVLQMYAQSLAENNQAADALHITQLALKNDPSLVDMHILAGRLMRSTGQLDQAIDHFSACLTLDSNFVEAYLEMARTYQDRRDYKKATTMFQKAIEIAPHDYRSYYNFGLLLRDAKDYKGAEAMLRRASELSKDDVNILRQLGAIIALNLVHTTQEAPVQS